MFHIIVKEGQKIYGFTSKIYSIVDDFLDIEDSCVDIEDADVVQVYSSGQLVTEYEPEEEEIDEDEWSYGSPDNAQGPSKSELSRDDKVEVAMEVSGNLSWREGEVKKDTKGLYVILSEPSATMALDDIPEYAIRRNEEEEEEEGDTEIRFGDREIFADSVDCGCGDGYCCEEGVDKDDLRPGDMVKAAVEIHGDLSWKGAKVKEDDAGKYLQFNNPSFSAPLSVIPAHSIRVKEEKEDELLEDDFSLEFFSTTDEEEFSIGDTVEVYANGSWWTATVDDRAGLRVARVHSLPVSLGIEHINDGRIRRPTDEPKTAADLDEDPDSLDLPPLASQVEVKHEGEWQKGEVIPPPSGGDLKAVYVLGYGAVPLDEIDADDIRVNRA